MLMANVLFSKFAIFTVTLMQDNNLERAADWIFSHAHELDSMEEESSANQETGPQYNDGPGSKYQYKTGLFVL